MNRPVSAASGTPLLLAAIPAASAITATPGCPRAHLRHRLRNRALHPLDTGRWLAAIATTTIEIRHRPPHIRRIPIARARLFDSRIGHGIARRKLAGQQPVDIEVAGHAGVPATGATASTSNPAMLS